MLYAAVALAAVALLAALVALAKASTASARAAEAERDARRRADNAAEELRGELETLKQLLAVLATGGSLTRDQVLEGRLWSDLSPERGASLLQEGELRLVDVRTPQETAAGIIPGALLIPVDELPARMAELPRDGKTTLVYCAGGGRSAAACELLSRHGYTNLRNLEGGFGAWPGPRARPAAP
jgi:rhodanese-related sulfurtransferase